MALPYMLNGICVDGFSVYDMPIEMFPIVTQPAMAEELKCALCLKYLL